MSDFGKLEARFWQRGTGKRLRGDKAAQVLAMYLMSCESARALGLFYLPWALVTSETGLTDAEARAAFARLETEGFAFYDHAEELAWVPGMAIRRVGEEVKDGDKKRAGVVRDFLALAPHRFRDLLVAEHGARYRFPGVAESFRKATPEGASKGLPVRVEAPSKGDAPLAGIEEEEDKEEEREAEGEAAAAADPGCAMATYAPPPVRGSSNPDAVKILDRLRAHPELLPIATVGHAERIAGLLMTGKRLDWLLLAIDELADKAAAAALSNAPWAAEYMGGKAMAFARSAKAPRPGATPGGSGGGQEDPVPARRGPSPGDIEAMRDAFPDRFNADGTLRAAP